MIREKLDQLDRQFVAARNAARLRGAVTETEQERLAREAIDHKSSGHDGQPCPGKVAK